MPYEVSSSPVAPRTGSRLWTVGAGAGVSITALLAAAALQPENAVWLLPTAALVGFTTWALNRTPSAAAGPEPARETPGHDQDAGLLENVFEALAEPVFVVSGGEADDIAGRRIILANGPARDLLRIQRGGALLVPVLRDPAVLEAVDEALFGGLSRTTDYAGVGAQTRHWRACTCPLPPGPAGPLALVVLRDETEVRRTEMMRVDFLANASHELKTPLASLSGFIETLKGHARDDAKARDKFLDIMATQADRMSRLVSDLLSLSRIELNEHIPPAGPVSNSPTIGRGGAGPPGPAPPPTSSTPSASCRPTARWPSGSRTANSAPRCTATGTKSCRWSRIWSTTPSNIPRRAGWSRSSSVPTSPSTRPPRPGPAAIAATAPPACLWSRPTGKRANATPPSPSATMVQAWRANTCRA
jgi:hypothetical protein